MAKINIGKDNPQGITKGIAAGIAVFFILFVYCVIANKVWIIPFGLILAGIWSIYRGYLSSKSNSTTQIGTGVGSRVEDNTGNVPLIKTPQFWIGVALIVIGIIVIFMQRADYRAITGQ